MEKIKLALIGAGNRGKDAYANIIYKEKLNADFVAVVDPDEEKRQNMIHRFNIDKSMAFSDEDEFFKLDKVCNTVIIATQDKHHYSQSMKALEAGYDIILEKPISTSIKEIVEIEKKAIELDCQVIVCHVLRYHPMWRKIKDIIDSGELGKIVTINHNENIGHYHLTHSYVRGNWNNSNTSAPITLTKTCHDFDILYWLIGSKCKHISSFGSTAFFIKENAPEGSADRCFDCKYQRTCEYSGMRVYSLEGGHSPAFFTNGDFSKKAITRGLKETNYGSCIWKAGNNVCTQQANVLEFENGVTANFNINGFTRHTSRTIKIMCEKGEIHANYKRIYVTLFKLRKFALGDIGNFIAAKILDGLRLNKSIKRKYRVNPRFSIKSLIYGHGGADYHFTKSFVDVLTSNMHSKTLVSDSIESHLMAFAAEESRINKQTIVLDEYKQKILSNK